MSKLVNLALAAGMGVASLTGCVIVETRLTRIEHVMRMKIPWEEVDRGDARPKTIEEIAQYQQACIKHAQEVNFDDWKSAERTHRDGYGDCEDYAINAAYFLEKIGHEPLIMIFPRSEKVPGHAVAVFKTKDENGFERFGYIDNGIYGYPIFDSFANVAGGLGRMHAKNWGVEYVWKDFTVVNLNEQKCDWGHGKENLQPNYAKYCIIRKK